MLSSIFILTKKRQNMKPVLSFFIFLIFSALVLYSGCKDSITANKLDSIIIPDSNVSYSQYIQPVFNLKCINCHGNGEVSAGLNLTTWSGTIADPNVVFPGKPENSSLVWAIRGNYQANAEPMPPVGSSYKPLTQNQVDGVVTWIKEGAKNN